MRLPRWRDDGMIWDTVSRSISYGFDAEWGLRRLRCCLFENDRPSHATETTVPRSTHLMLQILLQLWNTGPDASRILDEEKPGVAVWPSQPGPALDIFH